MNSIFILYPTRSSFGIWSFDDPTRGLKGEPFVGETNKLIDGMAEESGYDLKDNPQIALLFSASEFPGHQCDLTLLETSPSGTTYNDKITGLDIWLCPAFYKYYEKSPQHFFGSVVPRLKRKFNQ